MSAPGALLSGIVVHWQNEEALAELVAAWPRDPRFELIVVDNGSARPLPAGPYALLSPAVNLGFAGGANLGFEMATAPAVLLLNPDARPEPGALEHLLAGLAAHPEAAGLAPRLVGHDGRPQFAWQLRRLPRLGSLLAQAVFLAPRLGPKAEPAAGAPVEQPAAAALLLRRSAWEAVGGFDERFHPAWFEDVDLASRLREHGLTLRYWPAAVFRHQLGASVPRLGYGLFLWIYDRNLLRYTARHHGRPAALAMRGALALGALSRLAALPLRRPRRAASRREAAAGLLAVAAGVLSGWRLPRAYAARFVAPAGDTR